MSITTICHIESDLKNYNVAINMQVVVTVPFPCSFGITLLAISRTFSAAPKAANKTGLWIKFYITESKGWQSLLYMYIPPSLVFPVHMVPEHERFVDLFLHRCIKKMHT